MRANRRRRGSACQKPDRWQGVAEVAVEFGMPEVQLLGAETVPRRSTIRLAKRRCVQQFGNRNARRRVAEIRFWQRRLPPVLDDCCLPYPTTVEH